MIAVILVLFATLGNPEMVPKNSLDNSDHCAMILEDERDTNPSEIEHDRSRL